MDQLSIISSFKIVFGLCSRLFILVANSTLFFCSLALHLLKIEFSFFDLLFILYVSLFVFVFKRVGLNKNDLVVLIRGRAADPSDNWTENHFYKRLFAVHTLVNLLVVKEDKVALFFVLRAFPNPRGHSLAGLFDWICD